jgi:predicted MPP superfamily phosphohydrolase
MEPYRGKHNHPLRRLGERLLDTVLFGGLVAKWSYRCGPLCRAYCHGKFQIEDNGSLIVSRGIGCSTLPVRINADPELVICTLR